MKKVIVITQPDCIACRMLRYELKKRDIKYDAMDTSAATNMFNMAFDGAPITLIIDYSKRPPYNVERFNGYGKLTLDLILKEIGYETTKSTKAENENTTHIPTKEASYA